MVKRRRDEADSAETKAGGAAVECCSITSFFGEDGQVSIPLLCFLLLRSQDEGEGWASVAGMIYECTGRLLG